MKIKPNKTIALVFVLITIIILFFQTFQNLGKEHIKIWDEARGANNAIEMLENGNIWVVSFDGQPDHWNTKSPLFIWFKAVSYKIFGINEFGVRFPSALFTILLAFFLLYFSYKSLNEIWTGGLSILILASSPGFIGYHVARTGEPDTILTFFVFFYSIAWFLLLEKYPKKRSLLFTLFGVGVVFAVYAKNIAGIAPIAGLAVYSLIIYKKLLQILKDYRLYLAIFLIFIAIALHFLIREYYDPGYTYIVYKREIYGMFFDYIGGKPKHPEFSFYFTYLYKTGFKYLIWLMIPSIFALIIPNDPFRKKLIIFNFIFIFVFLLGYSSSEAKNEWYIAPVYPFFALLTAVSIYDIINYLNKLPKKPIFKYSIIALIVISFSWMVYSAGKKTFKKNKPWDQIYTPERPGYYLKKYITKYPEIKQYDVLASDDKDPNLPNYDQLKFYAKKHKHLNNTEVNIFNKIDSTLTGRYVFSCEKRLINQIKANFNYQIIEEDKYSTLFKIEKYLGKLKFIKVSLGNSWYPVYKNKIEYIGIPNSLNLKETIGFSASSGCDSFYLWQNDYSGYIIEIDQNKLTPFKFKLPDDYKPTDIITMAFDAQTNKVYSFCKNKKIIVGSYKELGKKSFQYSIKGYDEPPIYAAIINKNKKRILYLWYDNNKVIKINITKKLFDEKKTIMDEYKYNLPKGFKKEEIIDIAIGGKNNKIYTLIKR